MIAAKIVFTMTFGICVAAPLAAQSRLDKYLKFSPFSCTLDDVKKVYGDGKTGNNPYFVTYYRDGLRVSVEYAAGGCKSRIPIWNVPPWTVIEVTYSFLGRKPALRDLLAKRVFTSRQAGDVEEHVEYYNDDEGISILYDKDGEGVMDIVLRPSRKDSQKFQCP